MPNTPRVQFNFENNNVQNSTPLLGVSHVVARTTKGPLIPQTRYSIPILLFKKCMEKR